MTFEGARDLEAAGDDDAAKRAYVDVLRENPEHLGALNNLGALLYRTGFRAAARTALAQAVSTHPQSAEARVNLASVLYDDGEIGPACEQYEAALRIDPAHAQAHQSLAIAAYRAGDRAKAELHAQWGFRNRATPWPYRGTGKAPNVLVLFSALGGNVPIERFIDSRLFAKSTLVTEFCDARTELGPHDVVFNAVGDADRCATALEAAAELVARTKAPVINDPARVALTDRATNARRLGEIDDVVAPLIVRFTKVELCADDAIERLVNAGFTFPLLLRAPGFHTGQHFVKVEGPLELEGAAAGLPGEELLAIQFVDTRDADGAVRKYRVMFVDGGLYPLHLAISTNWKAHYFTADLMERPAHRAEEAAFLDDVSGVLGSRAVESLRRIAETLGLDYAGIDFGLDAEGNVVLFEANATMVLLPVTDERLAYRREAVERVRDAARAMIDARSRGLVSLSRG